MRAVLVMRSNMMYDYAADVACVDVGGWAVCGSCYYASASSLCVIVERHRVVASCLQVSSVVIRHRLVVQKKITLTSVCVCVS